MSGICVSQMAIRSDCGWLFCKIWVVGKGELTRLDGLVKIFMLAQGNQSNQGALSLLG